jgi:hypothetical protein
VDDNVVLLAVVVVTLKDSSTMSIPLIAVVVLALVISVVFVGVVNELALVSSAANILIIVAGLTNRVGVKVSVEAVVEEPVLKFEAP